MTIILKQLLWEYSLLIISTVNNIYSLRHNITVANMTSDSIKSYKIEFSNPKSKVIFISYPYFKLRMCFLSFSYMVVNVICISFFFWLSILLKEPLTCLLCSSCGHHITIAWWGMSLPHGFFLIYYARAEYN